MQAVVFARVVAAAVDVDGGADRDHGDSETGERSVPCCRGDGPFLSVEIENVEIVVDVDRRFKLAAKAIDFVPHDGDGV